MSTSAPADWSEAPYVLPGAVEHSLRLGPGDEDVWRISVALPPPGLRERAGDGPFPTLYLLDGYFTFAVAAQAAWTTFDFASGQLRPVAVVGISPAGDDRKRLWNRRNRDLTPTTAAQAELLGNEDDGTGGAAEMLDLIVARIIPQLESIHALDPGDRALGGWSLGGLFTCWALLQGGDTFRRYLAVSPSLWWDGKLLLDEKRAPAGELGPAGIYLAIGEHESDLLTAWPALDAAEAEIFGGLNMVADMRDFAARLRRHPGLAVTTEVIPDEHHCTVWGAAVTRGIVNLYRNDES